jgi:peptidoglycan-associated lipoprotein
VVASANGDSARLAGLRADSLARAEAARRDAARADSIQRAADARRGAESGARDQLLAVVHFGFDDAQLGDAERATLDRKAAILAANQRIRIRIDGNTDERGSDEYNLALGMRRAAAARRYLQGRGVDQSRVEIVSSGEEHPTCRDHDESCWSRNRRDDFVIVGGGDQISVVR